MVTFCFSSAINRLDDNESLGATVEKKKEKIYSVRNEWQMHFPEQDFISTHFRLRTNSLARACEKRNIWQAKRSQGAWFQVTHLVLLYFTSLISL